CACWLAWTISKMLNKKFSVKNNCIYDLYGAVKFIRDNHTDVMILDEMIEMAFKREHYKTDHFDFIKIINTQRFKLITQIWIIPHGSDLNTAIAKNIDLMFWVKKRGIYLVAKFKKRYWDLFIQKKEPPRFFEMIAVKFAEIPDDLWKEYEEYSATMKNNISQATMERIMKRQKGDDDKKDIADQVMEALDERGLKV
ncbi:hypothetical protein KAR91_69085, partial [Candidatus Pacearchaeota archaeon]|nr:hypothetical protein [Candidatus Pacearchaeota archaeon]